MSFLATNKLKKHILPFVLCLFLAVPLAHAAQYRVVAVSDGDTITIEPIEGGDRARVRLHGIDAPEMNQPYGQAAKKFVTELVLFKQVDIQPVPQGKDRYGRIVAVVEIPSVGILQELLLSEGLAWVYPQFCRTCDTWKEVQDEAREQGKGLWASSEPVAPWKWRRQQIDL